MHHNIKGTGLSITDEIRSYVERCLSRTDKFFSTDEAQVAVELVHQTSEDRARYRAEFTLSVGSTVYRAEALGGSLHEAIDIASGELVEEIRRDKRKKQRLFRRGAAQVKDFIRGFRRRF
jgi:ribosomal subunit interface protein